MSLDIKSLIGEATAYDKKQMLEVKRPKSWLKSVSAFAKTIIVKNCRIIQNVP